MQVRTWCCTVVQHVVIVVAPLHIPFCGSLTSSGTDTSLLVCRVCELWLLFPLLCCSEEVAPPFQTMYFSDEHLGCLFADWMLASAVPANWSPKFIFPTRSSHNAYHITVHDVVPCAATAMLH